MISPVLPSLLVPTESTASRGAQAPAAHTQWSGGRIEFENPNYLISTGDDGSVRVFNKNTHERYLAWGPPQWWVDGAQAFNFCGTTSLALHDGTLLTLTTQPLAGDALVTAISKVTITQGDYGVEITGLDSTGSPPLRFVQTQRYGWLLHAAVGAGNVVFENDQGAGFLGNNQAGGNGGASVWTTVDQAYIDATDLARLGALAGARGAAFVSLSGLFTITFGGIFRGPTAYRCSDGADRTADADDAPISDRVAQQWRLRCTPQGLRDGTAVWQVAELPCAG